MVQFLDDLNAAAANSRVGKYFKLAERGTTLTREIRAGTSTFLTVCYILAVNAAILADSGGACSSKDCTNPSPFCMFGTATADGFLVDAGYEECKQATRRSLVAATAATSLMANTVMGLWSNMPLAICPGMGMNAYFAYTVVGYHGSGMISYKSALAAIFVEGVIFFALALSGLRSKIYKMVPKSLMFATAGGIGLFLAFLGLQTAEGIGLVTYEPATLVTLGACPIEKRVNQFSITADGKNSAGFPVCRTDENGRVVADVGPASPNYGCVEGEMTSPSFWLGVMGGMAMVVLIAKGVRGAVVVGIAFITFISWIPNHGATYIGASSQLPGGAARKAYFEKVVELPDTSKTTGLWDFSEFGNSNLWAALFTFLYLDFLDGTGTLYSMATFLNAEHPGFIDENNNFEGQTGALCSDAIGTMLGAIFGSSPLTTYIESAVGIKDGGRTGLVSLVVAFWFFLSLFFVPIISSVPPYATGPALIMVGALMMENLRHVPWEDIQHAIPAFLTVAIIPLTYSIAYGIIAGITSYFFIWLAGTLWDICAIPVTGRALSDILVEATPEVFGGGRPNADGAGKGTSV